MKTWTNPAVEELEVKLTAALGLANTPEYEENGVIQPELILGKPGYIVEGES